MFNRFSFDSVAPFRRYPWLYTLVITACVGVMVLFSGLTLYHYFGKGPKSVVEQETPVDKSDRLEVMNVLNRFHLDEGQVPLDSNPEEKNAKRQEHIASALARLKLIETQGSIQSAQNDLIKVFSSWNERVRSHQETYALRSSFITLGKKYPWMNTLLWLIMLNRL